jgi:hypothetical protein
MLTQTQERIALNLRSTGASRLTTSVDQNSGAVFVRKGRISVAPMPFLNVSCRHERKTIRGRMDARSHRLLTIEPKMWSIDLN